MLCALCAAPDATGEAVSVVVIVATQRAVGVHVTELGVTVAAGVPEVRSVSVCCQKEGEAERCTSGGLHHARVFTSA